MAAIPTPSDFIEALVVDQHGRKLVLQPHQKRILNVALECCHDGKLRYSTIVYSAPKKSGKTQIAAAIVLYFAFVLAEPKDEIYIAANSREHARSRVYRMVRDAVMASAPLRKAVSKVEKNVIATRRGVEIHTVAANAGVIAGAAPLLSCWDELWAYETEGDRTLYDELAPVPTKKNSVRLITTYAGFLGRSALLQEIYQKGMSMEPHPLLTDLVSENGPVCRFSDDTFFYWDHEPRMPWQTKNYYERERSAPGMRLSTFLRIHRNMWVHDESGIDMDMWDRAVRLWHESERPPKVKPEQVVTVGVDLGVSRDSAAVAVATRAGGRILVSEWRMWEPPKGVKDVLDVESTVEAYLTELGSRYCVAAVYYDPWQMVRSAQILVSKGLPMVPMPQTESMKVRMGNFLLESLSSGTLAVPEDSELRSQAAMALIKETSRGVKLAKSQRYRDDGIHAIALAMLACDENIPVGNPLDQVVVI